MNEKRDFVVGMLVGSAIGAAVALLYAPQAGDETRDLIKQKAGEAKDKAGELATTAKEKASSVAETISTTVTEKANTVREKAGTVRESAAGMVEQVKTTAQDLVDRGRSLVETKKGPGSCRGGCRKAGLSGEAGRAGGGCPGGPRSRIGRHELRRDCLGRLAETDQTRFRPGR